MNNKTRQDAYKKVISLKKQGFGRRRIYQNLQNDGYTHISEGSISYWLYYGGKPRNEPTGNFEKLTSEKAFVLGVVGPGDGYICSDRIGLQVIDEDFALKFKASLEKVYGLTCKQYLQKISGYGKLPRHKIMLYSNQSVLDLISYGVSLREKDWRVPNAIKEAKEDVKAEYIQGFSDSQGSVGKRNISLASKNLKGILEIKQLLVDMGIRASVQKGSNTYLLAIQDRKSLEDFYSKIGFCTERKERKLATVLNKYKFYGTPTKKVDNLMPKIIELRRKGYKQYEIANSLNLNQSTICRRLKNGLK
ncbi:MAG: hypothetical protein KKC75_03455 [Nanoarchaeota archaeon]|nr:hypothetical protein [Nanoarchaeota archaeon]MBU1004200.1 hypothetical protein [Nanoarchaeota archaeon]MBU1945348.1 hypothetical protein [Nanoarchaeota archaeon]